MADDRKSDAGDAGLGLEGEDRLPWLEAADDYEGEGDVSPARLLIMVLGGLLLIGALLGGLWWMQNGGARGQGELIVAEKGNYKVAPTTDGAKTFEGEGDAAFAASEGKETTSNIAAKPADDKAKADAKAGATATAAATAKPGATAVVAASAAVAAGAVFVQLGAFGDSAKADAAWSALGKRFGFLSGVNRRVAEGTSEGGRKVYRLQAITANSAAAQQLCAKLKAGGENCLIVK